MTPSPQSQASGSAGQVVLLKPIKLPEPPPGATRYYVSPTGFDSNPGTAAKPFRTIQHAADAVKPGDTVIVEDGIYSGTSGSAIVTLNRGGNSSAWISFEAANKWRAKLDGRNLFNDGFAFASGASHIRIKDFDIYGMANIAPGGATGIDTYNSGGFIDIVGNNIHNIGNICTDTSNGQNGVFSAEHDITIERNLIHDIGRFAPGEKGCRPLTPYYQNHDHGIYIYGGRGYTIQNNVFFNNTHGWGIQLYPNPLAEVVIVNNTFAQPNPYRDGHIIVATTVTNSFIANNLFYRPATGAINFDIIDGSDSLIVANNLSTSAINVYTTTPTGVTYTNNLSRQPVSAVTLDPTDYHLIVGGPAIRAGTSINAPLTDFNDFPRPSPPSIGAYEFGSREVKPAIANRDRSDRATSSPQEKRRQIAR